MNRAAAHQTMRACSRLAREGCQVLAAHSINGQPHIQACPSRLAAITANALVAEAARCGILLEWRTK